MAIYYDQGRYRVRFVDQALGKASTGTPQFVLRFLVLSRIVSPDQLEPVTQYERTAYFYITEKTAERLSSDLKTLGFQGESFRELDIQHPECHDFRDSEGDMYCGHGTNQKGEPKEQWGVARQASQLDVKPLDSREARQLDNLFGKYLKSNGSSKPASTPPPARTAPAAATTKITDDDVPF